MAAIEEEEDDYMSMTITEPNKPKERETYTQRRIRKEREAEQKGRTKSRKELDAEAAAARDAALATSLPVESRGYKMMAKLGFRQGGALGSANNPNARIEPIGLEVKEDRGGVGLDGERKRKFREEMEEQSKKTRAEEGDYRERVAKEKEDRRLEGLIGAAMRLAEQMDEENSIERQALNTEGNKPNAATVQETGDMDSTNQESGAMAYRKPSRHVNVLWGSLVRGREEKERERLMRYNLLQSLSRNAKYDDLEEDEQDRLALGKVEEDIEEEDPELDAFEAKEPAERLRLLVEYLRITYSYCFWCKHRYLDSAMDGCPGIIEEDHD